MPRRFSCWFLPGWPCKLSRTHRPPCHCGIRRWSGWYTCRRAGRTGSGGECLAWWIWESIGASIDCRRRADAYEERATGGRQSKLHGKMSRRAVRWSTASVALQLSNNNRSDRCRRHSATIRSIVTTSSSLPPSTLSSSSSSSWSSSSSTTSLLSLADELASVEILFPHLKVFIPFNSMQMYRKASANMEMYIWQELKISKECLRTLWLLPQKRLCFTRLHVFLSLFLFACLLATSHKNYWSNLHENFTGDVSVEKEELVKFWKTSASRLESRKF